MPSGVAATGEGGWGEPTERPCWVAFGGNLGPVAEGFVWALGALAQSRLLKVSAISSLYRTEALIRPGAPRQPDYLNAVVAGTATMPPSALIAALNELAGQRARRAGTAAERWQPRALDLDLLAYGDHSESQPHCLLPHPGLAFRPFVLWPLAEVAPGAVFAPFGRTAGELLRCLARPRAHLQASALSWQRPIWRAAVPRFS